MNDTFNIPNNELKTQVFYSSASGATNQWQTWSKPSNAKLIHFTVIGGGGGGAGGAVGISGGTRSGGGGGGSSSITTGLFPASLLPDTLYIQVGSGGAGGAGGPSGGGDSKAGVSGSLSYISLSANTNFANIVLASGTVAPTGGIGNNLITNGVGGTIFSVSNSIIGKIGIINSIAGQNGAIGGIGATVSGSITITNLPITGGAGGGGAGATGLSGGSINAFAFLPRVSGGASSGGIGSDGYENIILYNNLSNKLPFITTGGAGGGGFATGTGGKGGNGGYGSGGAGGGSGWNFAPFSGGTGGDGGNGIVIITVF